MEEVGAWADPSAAGAAGGGTGESAEATSGAEFFRDCADRLETLVEDLKGAKAAGKYPEKADAIAAKLQPQSEVLRDLADEYEEEHGETSLAERSAVGVDEEEEATEEVEE